ncbi:MAG TPA: Crp/Fnr family transcriptional regulator [Longimicrobiaceae bacterium]|nr:Crp/Fnr family transcriptional regulator [Longimicrobiaceae bacterium]
MEEAPRPPFRNRILAGLPEEVLERLRPALEPVELKLGQVVAEPNRPIGHVVFPEEGIVSIVAVMLDGSAVETATVGSDGMAGLAVFLGAGSMAGEMFVQVPGHGHRMAADVLRAEVSGGGVLFDLLGRYAQALFTMLSQSSACNRKHPLDARCARWLLLTHDRVDGDAFHLTHLILSQMLGVRRATVSEAAGRLQAAGLIEYSRGRLTILDRPGLERVSCECYAIIRSEFARLVEGVEWPSPLDGA